MSYQDQTPPDLSTSDQTGADNGGDDFSSFSDSVATLAGAAFPFVQALNSPKPNNVPSNVPSTAPTPPASQTSTFAGWSMTKKIVVGVSAFVGLILAALGLKKLFS